MVAAIDDVTEAMKDVVDPELGINVVDLGLIYDVMVDENNIAVLNMTLTSAACPLDGLDVGCKFSPVSHSKQMPKCRAL